VKEALSLWGRKVGEATRKAEDLSRNTWQHREHFFPKHQRRSSEHTCSSLVKL
jgi:hypothetical protein